MDAPGDGLEALVDEAALEEVEEGLSNARLIDGIHSGVGRGPATEAAQADELFALQVEVLLGVLAAGTANGQGIHLQLFAAKLFIHLDLNGQAVAVPAGNVGGVEAGHGLGFDDEVLERLVECVAEMDGSVGVGRTVVEDVAGRAGAGGADLGVEVLFFPDLRRRGSLTGRLAFIGKAVWGRFSVDLSGLGSVASG